MFRALSRLFAWLDEVEVSYPQLIAGVLSGMAVGYFLTSATEQTALLQDLYILAQEQRRIAIANTARALSATKETLSDGTSNAG